MATFPQGLDEPRRKASKLRREFMWASVLFAFIFVTVLGLGSWILLKDLGEKEVFRVLQAYSAELETLLQQVPTTKTLQGFQQKKLITTRLDAFFLERQVFDSYELYDEDGKLFAKRDVPRKSDVVAGPDERGLLPGQQEIVLTPKIPIQMPVPIEPGKMGKAVLSVSQDVLTRQAQEFRREMMTKVLVMMSTILLLLILAYIYILRVLRLSRRIESEGQEQERLSYLGLLSSGLAHEIKNPLNSMQMNLQLFEEELTTGPGCEEPAFWIEPIRKEIFRLERLVNEFLLFSRPMRPAFTSLPLKPFLDEIRRFHEVEASRKEVTLESEAEPDMPPVRADAGLLRNAVTNLVLNSLQAAGAGGRVTLKAYTHGGRARIDVHDTGSGIPPDRTEEVFQIFVTTKPGGTGLGLPIARRLTESQGGGLWAVSKEQEPHEGQIIRMELPFFKA